MLYLLFCCVLTSFAYQGHHRFLAYTGLSFGDWSSHEFELHFTLLLCQVVLPLAVQFRLQQVVWNVSQVSDMQRFF